MGGRESFNEEEISRLGLQLDEEDKKQNQLCLVKNKIHYFETMGMWN